MKEIYLGRAGSISYGTNTPTSDEDYRGIFVADPKFIRTPFFKQNEYRHPDQKDSVSYELSKFMQLYTECNPNIVELLWIEENDVILDSPAYQLLRKHRRDLMSSRAAFTFSGYAVSQLKQMKNQSKWQNNPQPTTPPRQIDYVSLVVNYTNEKVFKIDLEEYHDGYRLVHYGGNIYGLYKDAGAKTYNDGFHLNVTDNSFDHTTADGERKLPLMIVKFNISEYKQNLETWNQYWAWKTLKDKKVDLYRLIELELAERASVVREVVSESYDVDHVVGSENMAELVKTMNEANLSELLHLCKRHLDFQATGTDFKHGMHLVRLLRMGREILEHGEVMVKRPDAKELLEIRRGSWSYEQLIAYGEEQDDLIRNKLYHETKLPKRPNIELASNLIMKVQDMVWGS